jgi:hypothetical protein
MRKFDLGRLTATPGAIQQSKVLGVDMLQLLLRHQLGDWGDLDAADKRANEEALKTGGRLLSAYGQDRDRIWIITEAATDACPACNGYGGSCQPELGEWLDGMHFRTDRPPVRLSTTILRPEDY